MSDKEAKIHAVTTIFDEISNQLKNEVNVSDYAKSDHSKPAENQQIEKKECVALWDTGATSTVISSSVITALRLPTLGKVNVWGVGGPSRTTLHVIDLWLPNLIIIPKLQVTMGFLGNDIDVLIGMDVIGKGDFAVSNYNGKTAFTYRIPSLEFTDYCKGLITR
jgi:hypothetical protein